MHDYLVSLEVAGPLAMFTRPDTGGTPTSYPAPTWSAAKAMFESVAMLRSGDAWINPTKVIVAVGYNKPILAG
jgi:CRISPR-associated protein Cas5d